MRKPATFAVIVLGLMLASMWIGCSNQQESLLVYSGKGLKKAMEEIKEKFEANHNITLNIVYAGSNTLLTTIHKTGKGDIFIPGSLSYHEEAGSLISRHDFVALHIPAFAVRSDNPKSISTYDDLIRPGVKIAVGNKKMCAIGRVAASIFKNSDIEIAMAENIVTTSSTVNELLDLVIDREVDASLVWADMLKWSEAEALTLIPIPVELNKIKKIHVAVLSISEAPKRANKFADFVVKEGSEIFVNYGFEAQ